MYTVFAKQRGATALYTLATVPTFKDALRACAPFRKCNPDGWVAGFGGIGGVPLAITEPTAEVAALIAKWKTDAEAGTVKASTLAIQAEEAKRYEQRKRLVEEGLYKWSDFDLDADDGYDGDDDGDEEG
jgi:hypothetical protein